MYIYTNINSEIKVVSPIELSEEESLGLSKHYFDENSESYVFKKWSVAKILCYRIFTDEQGNISGIEPYINIDIIEQIERLEKTKASQEIVNEIEEQNLEMLYQICLLQLGITDKDISASK